MAAVSTIQRVLQSNLLSEGLIYVSSVGASMAQLEFLEGALPRALSPQHRAVISKWTQHRAVISKWNGINIEVIRVFGTGETEDGLPRIECEQADMPAEMPAAAIAIANDATGFVYYELQGGSIVIFNHDGGAVSSLATDIDDFFDNLVFGHRSAEFMGSEWLDELRKARLVQP